MQVAPEDIQEFRFTVVKGAKPGSKISLAGGGQRTVRIGRAVDNDIVINDPTVSRSHVRVDIRPEGFFICDAGSAAGVEKMGFRVGSDPEPLVSGDEFKLGDTILKFEVVAKRGAKKLVPSLPTADATGAPAAPAPGPLAGFQQIFARAGLKTPRMQLAAGAALVLLLALLLWPEAPGLPPQTSGQPVAMEYGRIIGYTASDQSHLDGAILTIPSDVEGLAIYFETYSSAGVELRSGAKPIGLLEPSADWQAHQVLLIPRAMGGGRSTITFDHLGYSPEQGDIDPAEAKAWGLRRAWLARLTTSGTPAQLASELRSLGQVQARVDDNPGNRYALLRGLRNDALGLMKIVGRTTVLLPIPDAASLKPADVAALLENARTELEKENAPKALDRVLEALQQVEAILARDFRRQSNALSLARKKGASGELGATLAILSKMIPEDTDPRKRIVRGEIGKMDWAANQAYQNMMQTLGTGLADR